jgi:phosphoribosylformylglycinamidine synthase
VSLALERPTQRQECPVARVVVDVMLKPEILDPQGQAVANALPRLGVADVASVRIGKRIEIEFDGSADLDALAHAREIADKLLANPVIEDFTLRIEEQQPEGEEQ